MSLHSAFNKYPAPSGINYAYGTAGFRYFGDQLDSVAFKVGVIATLRSICLGGKTIGIVITASHNPPDQNGVKVVDPMGEMLPQSWEPFANQLANTKDWHQFNQLVQERLPENYLKSRDIVPMVVIARDTRQSGPRLVSAVIDGVNALNGHITDFGMLTTPQLHYITRCSNDGSFGVASEQGYYNKLIKTVTKILQINNYDCLDAVTVDTANGIGGDKLQKINALNHVMSFHVINGDTAHPLRLNVDCGADYVKTNQRLPHGVGNPIPDQLYASFDGDADRLVCYFMDKGGKFRLLDGDRIATLFASLIGGLLCHVKGIHVTTAIIQTAYSNGSSTEFIREKLGLPVYFTSTGVKHLHEKAIEFDVGIYFEANGHGTVVFSKKYLEELKKYEAKNSSEQVAVDTLILLVDLINQAVGDSISDLITVLVALKLMKKSVEKWGDDYSELANKLFKLKVADRFVFKTTDAERRLIEPVGVQEKIDEVVKRYSKGRSFVRASGTEDAVRVYSEAANEDDCTELGEKVCEIVKGI
ncbi:hypothetical protein FOA43_002976 [Brettanomyces nanus]|uniref:Phosphoacetylglucosamine mutase n=1 Tax=Eeniella nana TaxID=13502 RepID=A0A875S7D4_EENNA|nr:uncharacterized protein FOA43_002976 [Brettanomyces nanus]QPG75619.1 hypothetical protein FOA43_002976 [Brettanomyces nanus]